MNPESQRENSASLTTAQKVINGINLILKYEPDAEVFAEQGVIYFGSYKTRKTMNWEEQQQMESWGWRKQNGNWRQEQECGQEDESWMKVVQ
jgi:hypothetical protein